jgi:threonine synthase
MEGDETMLYVTTRSKHDVFTAARTMNLDRGPDGGLFIPFHLPQLSRDEIAALGSKSFGQNVADILNLFFSTKLTGWDVDMAIGRSPVKFQSMNYRIIVGEMWHNMDRHFGYILNALAAKVHPDGEIIGKPSSWVQIAVRIAVLFGIYGELLRGQQIKVGASLDIASASGSFAAPMSAWYARKMGLPIGTIICGCNENSAAWDLLHRGELDTDALAIKTNTPEGDFSLPPDLERLICETCGQDEAMHYFWSCTEGSTYAPPEPACEAMRKGMFAAVVSHVRVETIIPSVYRTNQYILDLYSALAYGALSDYRARTGGSSTTLLLCEKNPLCNGEAVAKSMRISVDELSKRLFAS